MGPSYGCGVDYKAVSVLLVAALVLVISRLLSRYLP